MLESSSGSKFPVWLAGASFITEKKKIHSGLISLKLVNIRDCYQIIWRNQRASGNPAPCWTNSLSRPTSECSATVGCLGYLAARCHSVCISLHSAGPEHIWAVPAPCSTHLINRSVHTSLYRSLLWNTIANQNSLRKYCKATPPPNCLDFPFSPICNPEFPSHDFKCSGVFQNLLPLAYHWSVSPNSVFRQQDLSLSPQMSYSAGVSLHLVFSFTKALLFLPRAPVFVLTLASL